MKNAENTNRTPTSALWRQLLSLLPVYLNVFMMGCTLGWPPNVIYFMKKNHEISATMSEFALIISSTEVGRLLMAIPAGLLVDKFGRKKIINASAILHLTSWLILSLNASHLTLYIARFVLGIAIAFVNSTAMISIGELASPEIRAQLTAIYQNCLLLGIAFEVIISILFSSYFKLSYYTLAICFLNFAFLYQTLETPNYLISISQNDKALKNLKYVRYGYSEDEIISEFDNMKRYIETEKKRKLQTNWLDFINSKEIAAPLRTAFLINFFSMIVGTNTLTSFIIAIIPENEFISKQYYPLISLISGLAVSLLLPLYIEKYPRRFLFMSGAMGLVLCFLVLTVTYFCYSIHTSISETSKWIYSSSVFITIMVISGTVQPMNSVLRAEILPQSVKGFGNSLCVIAQCLASIVAILVFEFVHRHFGLHYNYIIYAVNSLILFFLVRHIVPECRGKLLSEIQIENNEKLGAEFK